MSFSISYIGEPEILKRKIEEESSNLSGFSKLEFDHVKPALLTILDQYKGDPVVVKLEASGYGTFQSYDSKQLSGTVAINIHSLGKLIT